MEKQKQEDRLIEEMLKEQRSGEEWNRVEDNNFKVAEVYA